MNTRGLSARRTLTIVFALLVLLTVFRGFWLGTFNYSEKPEITQGIAHWEQLKNYPVALSGDWVFVPEPGQLNESGEKASCLPEASGTGQMTIAQDLIESCGTYRLDIFTGNKELTRYALHIPKIHRSVEIRVNGELLYADGQKSTSREEENAASKQTIYFDHEGPAPIQLAIQTDQPNGYLVERTKPIYFGPALDINQYLAQTKGIVLFSCAIYLLHALYGLIFFWIGKELKRDLRLLHFSLIIMLIIFATLTTENFLYEWTDISYEWHARIMVIGTLFGGYLMLQIAKQQNAAIAKRFWYKGYYLLGLAILVSVLALPYSIGFTYASVALTVFSSFLLLRELFRAVRIVNTDNLPLFLGLVTALYSFGWLVVIELTELESLSYPFDVLLAIVFIAIYFFKQYFSSLKANERFTAELQQADKLKDDFLLAVGYEMKSPLSKIQTTINTLVSKEAKGFSKDGKEQLEQLDRTAHEMSFLLNDLLELEKIKGKQLILNKQWVPLHRMVQSVIDLLSYATDQQQVQLINEIPESFPLIEADERRLQQIIFNLLYNSVRFAAGPHIRVAAKEQGGWAEITVSGVSRNIKEQPAGIFNGLHEPSNSRSFLWDRTGGPGLMLSEKLIELHGGTLAIETKPKAEVSLTFTLEVSEMDEGQVRAFQTDEMILEKESSRYIAASTQTVTLGQDEHLSAPAEAHEAIRILAVDEDPVTLQMIQTMFSAQEYEVTVITDAQQALGQIREKCWHIVIASVLMPQMSGYEFTREIRKTYTMAELPVLLLLTYSQEENINFGFLAGANDYVTKPLNTVELYSRVNALVDLKKTVDEQLRVEGAWLQAQIRPHFIINSFLSIIALSRIDLDRMEALTEQLTNYIRLSIDFRNIEKLTAIGRELELVQSYLAIQQEKFPDRVHIICDVEDGLDIQLPPLSIQSLVENALMHGLFPKEQGGTVTVRAKSLPASVEIEVSDDGAGMSRKKVESVLDVNRKGEHGIGLINTDRRLRQMYGKGLDIRSTEGVGTSVSFIVPRSDE